jgi:hypothetical protein
MSHGRLVPTLGVVFTDFWDSMVAAVRGYASQLRPVDDQADGLHFLSHADLLVRMETKARAWGEAIGVAYGEPLLCEEPLAVGDPLLRLLAR